MPELKYIGMGSWMYGIPAKDLTAEEVEKHGGVEYLVGTGLYEVVKRKKGKTTVSPPPGYVGTAVNGLVEISETENER